MLKDNWKSFYYKSDSGRYRYEYHNSPKKSIYYHHWLPEDQQDLLPQKLPALDEKLPDFYVEFDTLVHATTLENAQAILQHGFKPRPVVDSSVVNDAYDLMNSDGRKISPRPQHPIGDVNVLWYGPCTFQQLQDPTHIVKRYGNVVFNMSTLGGYEGIRREGLNMYFIEVIEYMNSTACRILITHRNYPKLKKYDPYTIGGPLYIDGNRFYSTNRLKRQGGLVVNNVLEIMQEEWVYNFIQEIRIKNHCVSFFYCQEARKGVSNLVVPLGPGEDVTENGIMPYLLRNILKLAIALATDDRSIKVKLRTPFASEHTRDEKLRQELKRVHEEAKKRYDEGEHSDLINLSVHGVIHKLMSKRSIVDSYCDMLLLLPKGDHPDLADEIWKKLSKILESPFQL